MHKNRCANTNTIKQNNSERPVDALAVKKRDPLTDNLKSRDASASKSSKSGSMWETSKVRKGPKSDIFY